MCTINGEAVAETRGEFDKIANAFTPRVSRQPPGFCAFFLPLKLLLDPSLDVVLASVGVVTQQQQQQPSW